MAIVLLLAGGFGLFAIVRGLPNPEAFQNRQIRQSTKIYDRTGTILLYEIHGEERRTVIPFATMPDVVKYATLAAEDIKFYRHSAFDIKGIIRGLIINPLFNKTRVQGGSTITQQLVKNALLTRERTIVRKIKELILAIEFERRYSKDEILGFYLNQIPYGSNAYGVEAAAETYFGKPAAELTLGEAAALAALPKAPSYYAAHPDELRTRTTYILDRMADENFISRDAAERAKKEQIAFIPFVRGIRAPHFVMYIKQLIEEKYGKEMVENGGLIVTTTLDWDLQQAAEEIVGRVAAQNETQWNAANAALVTEDPNTGQILALVGSRNFFEPSRPEGCTPGLDCMFDPQVNAAMRPRQPGSAFKPFVYYTAFTKGYTPETLVFDVPTEFNPNCDATGKTTREDVVCYHPQNYDLSWRGPVTLRQALAQSLNIPAVKVLYLAGLSNAIATAKDFGITTFTEPPGFYGLSLVLGGGGVKLNELTHAYSVLAEDGIYRPQTAILRVADPDGNVLEEYEGTEFKVAESTYVRMVNDVLSDSAARRPMFAPGALDIPGYRIAAKTGTSQDSIDAWVFGYTPNLVTGIWVGNNNNVPMSKGGAGVSAAGPILREFIKSALPKFPQEDFPKPDPVELSSKPMLSGKYITMRDGRPELHDILYYVDKDDPTGPQPANPSDDDQFVNWDLAARAWATLALPDIGSPRSVSPEVLILEPEENAILGSDELTIRVELVGFPNPDRITISFNGTTVTELDANPDNAYSIFFIPSRWKERNEIRVTAERGSAMTSKTITVRHTAD